MARSVGGLVTALLVIMIIGYIARPETVAPVVEVLGEAGGTSTDVGVYEELEVPPSSRAEAVAAPSTPPMATQSTTTTALESITLAFTGDIIGHSALVDHARTAPGEYDFRPMFDRVAPVLRAADLAICHLEVPLDPESRAPRGFPRFSAPAELADAIAYAGYDGCSTASNHTLDRGIPGVGETLDVLDGAGLAHAGSARTPDERAGTLYEVGGAVIGHASYSYFVGGSLSADEAWVANVIDEDLILADAADLRAAGAEFVVVSLHWGNEFQSTPSARQKDLGATLIASPDIDLIVGHHAHVLQPVVESDGGYVFYGLGNFLSNQEPGCCGEEAQEGAIMLVRVTPAADSWDVTELAYVPTWVDRRGGYVILPTIGWKINEHRQAAWLERSAIRVGNDLQIDAPGLSVEQACEWMGTDCASDVAGSD